MSGLRIPIGVGCCVLVLGCGGAVEHRDNTDEPLSGGGSGPTKPNGRAGSSSGGSAGVAGQGLAGSAGKPNHDPPPVMTMCPTEDLPPPSIECDPYTLGDCAAGLGCYPYVDHPEGKGCDSQQYGTVCLPAGLGTQDALCGDVNGDYCAPGFVCVVGQRAGKRCAALCDLAAKDSCQGGLICGDLDVAGFGVCG